MRTVGPRCARASAAVAAVLATAALLAGCAGTATGARPSQVSESAPIVIVTPMRTTPGVGGAGMDAPVPRPGRLPWLGPRTLARIPADARQVLLIRGAGRDASTATATLYRRDRVAGWVAAGPVWPARNAAQGWSDDDRDGELRTPVGVFTFGDAGGRLPDPGTRLAYHHGLIGLALLGKGVEGELFNGAFDYVIVVEYHRRPGTSPRDGGSRGGVIWLDVDRGGVAEGCVGLPRRAMRWLLRSLDPALHPVVVMGDAASLAR